MRILLLGGNGQVGHECRRSLATLGEVVITTRSGNLPDGTDCESLDLARLDTGTHQSLLEASNYIETIEARQGLRVCCPEEIAHGNGWIDDDRLRELARPLVKNGYGKYLLNLIDRRYVP